MAVSTLHKHRVQLGHLLEETNIDEKEKARWRKHIPKMMPSHILELRVNLLEQLVVDIQVQVIGDIQRGKEVPEDEEGLVAHVRERVVEKIALIEKKTQESLALLPAN